MRGEGVPYKVIHVSSTREIDTSIIGPLVDTRDATFRDMSTIEDFIFRADQTTRPGPIISLLSPIRIGLIPSISRQPGTQVEEKTVGNGILVIISLVCRYNLPPQTAITMQSIPSTGLSVENGLSEGKPLRLALWRVGKCAFSSRHSSNTPKGLIVVAERKGVCLWLVVLIFTNLVQHGLRHNIVELAVTSKMPIFNPSLFVCLFVCFRQFLFCRSFHCWLRSRLHRITRIMHSPPSRRLPPTSSTPCHSFHLPSGSNQIRRVQTTSRWMDIGHGGFEQQSLQPI